MQTDCMQILIVAALERVAETLQQQVQQSQRNSHLRCVGSGRAARAVLAGGMPDLALICGPLPDDDGLLLSKELHYGGCSGVLLLLPPDMYTAERHHAATEGILTLPMTADAAMLDSGLTLLCALRTNAMALERERLRLEQRLDDLKLVSRAKLRLIERCHMSEPEAQHYLERAAMNACCTKVSAARQVLSSLR